MPFKFIAVKHLVAHGQAKETISKYLFFAEGVNGIKRFLNDDCARANAPFFVTSATAVPCSPIVLLIIIIIIIIIITISRYDVTRIY